MAQIVYYATTRRRSGCSRCVPVPTGNFGNVLAGWIALRTGAPIHRLLIGSNCNDIPHALPDDPDHGRRGRRADAESEHGHQVPSGFTSACSSR
jgi:threonine synthase